MPLYKPGARHDGQSDLVEGGEQPLGGGLSRPAFGVARKQACDLLVLLCQSSTHHTLQHSDNPQSDGQEADETNAMIISLHIQRPQRQRVAFEPTKVALDQVFIAIGFDRPGQTQSNGLLVGGIDPPAQQLHRTLDGLLFALDMDLEAPDLACRRQVPSIRTNRLFGDLLLEVNLEQALDTQGREMH